MESLSDLLSPFDNIEIYCEEHGIPCIGLCADYSCKEKTKFLCMKCIKNGNTCITKQNHELVSLSEILYRFFIKEENKTMNFMQIQSMQQILKEFEKDDSKTSMANLLSLANNKTEQIENGFTNVLNLFIELFQNNNYTKIHEMKDLVKKDTQTENDINFLLDIELPKIDNNLDSQKKTIEFMNNGLKQENPLKFINSIKILNNVNKYVETTEKIENKIYVNNVTTDNIEKRKTLENKIDSLLDNFENIIDKKLSEIETSLIIPKDNESLFNCQYSYLKFSSDPHKLEYKEDICSTAHKTNSIDRVFCAFKAYTGESLVVWGTPQYSLECYDLEKRKITKTVIGAHSQTIFSCRHYVERKNKKDYIITSSYDRKIKVWDIKTWSIVVNIASAHSGSYIYSVCLLNEENENVNYIISSAPNEFMKVWNFSGKFLRNFGVNDESVYFIDFYHDTKRNEYYIINCNSMDVKSYVFKTGKLFKQYKGTPQTWHMSAVVIDNKEKPILVESDGNGNIRMWDFNTGILIKNISSSGSVNLRGICLWSEDYLFATGSDYKIKLFNLKEGKLEKSLKSHTGTVCTLEKVVHPKYGECLISQALDGKLKLWTASE